MPTPDFSPITLDEVRARLLRPEPTVILVHGHPDPDAIGSAFALALWLKEKGIPAYVVGADDIPRRMRFLTDGLQESILASSMPPQFAEARAVSVDVAAPNQLGILAERFATRVELMIDHHDRNIPFADYYERPRAAATGEIICELITAEGGQLSPRVAALLYAAISGDTGCFRFSNATHETHLHAATLVAVGIDTADINHRLFECKTEAQLTAEHAAYERLRRYADGRLAVITFPQALKEDLHLTDENLETIIDVARSVEGTEVAAVIKQMGFGERYRLSMRANVDFDVAAICAQFGGGGHVRAAGATMIAPDIKAAEAAIVAAVTAAL